ncbi:MAG: hypothetical protein ACI4JM_13395 [Oscillospiraceae bacterium]
MESVIRTNKVFPHFDYCEIDNQYDIFCLETSKKYINRGAQIIDAPLLNKNVKAVLFEKGRRFYVLLKRSSDNLSNLKSVLSDTEYGSSISISHRKSNEISDHQLLQLLINGLASKNHPLLRFNNLTGHLYVFMPEWIKKGKENIVWSIPTLEIKALEDCVIKLNVRTFTSTKLKNKITFVKKQFDEYPKYVLSSDNYLRRKTTEDKENKLPDFIPRQIDNQKNGITFLNISNIKAYEATKIGVLTKVVESFNSRYLGMARIEFQTIEKFTTIDTKATAKENESSVKLFLSDRRIKIIDCVNNQQSKMFCQNIADMIFEKYGCKVKLGSRLDPNELNIRLIHNKEYYDSTQNDPHQDDLSGYAVQHVTFEDFSHNSKYAVSTVIHELIVKDDISKGKISLFDWSKLEFDKDVAFGISLEGENPRYYFMTVKPDGKFVFSEQQMDLFEMNEYSTCVKIFDDDKQVNGVIRFAEDDILVIRNTEMFTLPEFQELNEELKNGNTALRSKDCRDEYLASVTEIRSYHDNNMDYYFVGVCGSGMRPTVQNSAVIRCVEQVKTGNRDFSRLLPLMNVSFVRNGQLTVIPFPFKYLREYVKSLKDNLE